MFINSKYPISCEWNITYKCNLRCKFCSLSCSSDVEEINILDDKNIKHIVNQLKDNKILYVSISGGEPLKHPKIYDIIDKLYVNGFIISLTTNGLLLNQEMMKFLKKRVKWIQMSIQSLNKEFNIKKMGVSPKLILKKINLVKSNDIGLSVASINFKEKEQELSNLKEYFHHKNIMHYIRGYIDTTKIKKIKRTKNIQKIVYFSILPNGDIVQCAELGIVAGNIFEIKLSEILKNRNLYVCNPQDGCLLLKG